LKNLLSIQEHDPANTLISFSVPQATGNKQQQAMAHIRKNISRLSQLFAD